MSRPIIPRPTSNFSGENVPLQPNQRLKKISTACGACKTRKTRCSGGVPCDACVTRSSQCIYDATSDQRRKVANQRNIQDLETAQRDLDRHRELLGGIIATIRAGDYQSNHELIQLVRSGANLSELAAHVRNECRSNLQIQQAFDEIEFIIDGHENLPSPMQIIGRGVLMEGEIGETTVVTTTNDERRPFSAQHTWELDAPSIDPTL